MGKTLTYKEAKAACLKLHSLIVRDAGNGCAAIGILPYECNGPLQCAHILPKKQNTYVSLDPMNGWVLCAAHHRTVDNSSNVGYWLLLVEKTCGTGLPLELLALQERMKKRMEGVSQLRWYRVKLLELFIYAIEFQVDYSSLPLYVKDWLRDQAEETNA